MGIIGIHLKSDNTLTEPSLAAFLFGFIFVELYFASPLYFIFKFNKKYIEFRHLPIIQMFINCLNCFCYVLLALYGIGDFQNLLTNTIGTLICLYCIFKLWQSLLPIKKAIYVLYLFTLFNVIFQIYYAIIRYNNDANTTISIINNIAMYLSLNIGTYYGFKENRHDVIPILSTVLGLIASTGWVVYSKLYSKPDDDGNDVTTYSNIVSFTCLIIPLLSYIFLAKCRKGSKNYKLIKIGDRLVTNNTSSFEKEMTSKFSDDYS